MKLIPDEGAVHDRVRFTPGDTELTREHVAAEAQLRNHQFRPA